MSKIFINSTNLPITINDMGLEIPANGQLEIEPYSYNNLSASDDAIFLLSIPGIIYNDGSRNLSISEAVKHIVGGFPSITGIVGPKGDNGDKGDKGDQGIQGEIGPQGPKGDQGNDGPMGPAGNTGLTEYVYASSEGDSGVDITTYSTKVELPLNNLSGGNYRLCWYFEFMQESNYKEGIYQVILDGEVVSEIDPENRDDKWSSSSGIKKKELPLGNTTALIQFKSSNNNSDVHIRRARLEAWKVG